MFLNSCTRNIKLISCPFSIASLVFIGLGKMLAIFGFVGDGIFDSSSKFGCHMKILLTICALFHGNGVNLGCRKITGIFWGGCWNIFEVLDYCWISIKMFILFSWRTLGGVGFWYPLIWCIGANYLWRLMLIF